MRKTRKSSTFSTRLTCDEAVEASRMVFNLDPSAIEPTLPGKAFQLPGWDMKKAGDEANNVAVVEHMIIDDNYTNLPQNSPTTPQNRGRNPRLDRCRWVWLTAN